MDVKEIVVPGSHQATEALESQPVTEAAAETAAASETPKEESNSQRLELFARKEAQIQRERQRLKSMEAEIKAKEDRLRKYEELETNKPDPVTLLQRYGYSYEDATNFILNNDKPTADLEIKRVKEELESFKKQTEQEKLRAQEEQKKYVQQQQAQAITDFKNDINDFVSEHSDEYELINLYEQQEQIFDVIDLHWKQQIKQGVKNPKVLSVKEAADMTEKYFEALVEKTLRTKKWQAGKFKPTEQAKEEKRQLTTQDIVKGKATTITNQMQGMAPSGLPAKTETDRISRALAALEN